MRRMISILDIEYLTLPYGVGILLSLLPSAEAYGGPNVHPMGYWKNLLGEQNLRYCSAHVLVHLELRSVFQTVFFVSEWGHCIFLEDAGCCCILLHKDDMKDTLFFHLQQS